MMFQLTFVFLGLLAVLGVVGAVSTSLDHETRTIAAAFSMAAWAYWSISAFSVETVSNGQVVAQNHVGLVALGAAASAIMLLVFAKLAFELLSGSTSDREVLDPHA